MKKKHTKTGNCFDVAFKCKDCGKDNLCDVCHEHEMPRGDCLDCQRCEICDSDISHQDNWVGYDEEDQAH